MGDVRQLESAVGNLVDNAVKYTAAGRDGAGTVTVTLEADADEAAVTVVDEGIGIAREHLDRIFERFYRVDRGRSRQTGGTGLGLAIVRHVVLNHGGSVSVESLPGEGSTFVIRLPYDYSQ
jgi:signal transduction histidine kinase